MIDSTFDQILVQREITNEKRVAIIRVILALAGVFELLAYFDIIDFVPKPTNATLVLSIYLLFYALIVLIVVLKSPYFKLLKFFVIVLDYSYVIISFIFDTTITNVQAEIKWFAFAAAVVFYLINLLRYSKEGTIFAGILSEVVFLSICIYFDTPFADIFAINIALFLLLSIGYSITISNKKMMVEANTKKMMERYLPPQLVGELYKNSLNLTPGGVIKNVTILFSDIRAFTTISERISPERVVEILNNYLSKMTDLIFSNHGTIDKFIGDAIMTIFGAPLESDDDAFRAVNTAILMQEALKDFNNQYMEDIEPLRMGIGIHTGEVIAGNIGSQKRLDYTVIGDNVNLTSRIEGLTVYYPCPILISESTYKELKKRDHITNFLIREVDRVIVKGRAQSITIFEVLDPSYKEIADSFEQALELYRNREFLKAYEEFNKLQQDKLSKLYMNRCQDFKNNPPKDNWDGTYIMETK